MAEADYQVILNYKEKLKEEDRSSEELYEERLSACKACERLQNGTCSACGCYVELRAAGKKGECPYHLWVR